MTGLCRSDAPLEQMIAKLARLPLRFQPGEKFLYGMSTDVLGRVVEVVSGTTLDRFIEDRICHPLGMTDTSFKVPSDKLARLASAYVPDQDGQIRKLRPGEMLVLLDTPVSSDYAYVDAHEFFSGGGGLGSTPADYMRLCQMLLNGGELNGVRLMRDETVSQMVTKQISELFGGSEIGFGFGKTKHRWQPARNAWTDHDNARDINECNRGGAWPVVITDPPSHETR
jgi:CubicO group peptidase (beta-lactamase class C family)